MKITIEGFEGGIKMVKSLTSINLSFGLLNIPIKVYPMRDSKSDSVDFVGLSNCCHSETGLKRYCKDCQNQLEWKTDLKGYKIGKEYIQLTKAELETIERLDNGIEILHFANANVPLVILDKPYLIEPTSNYKLYNLFVNLFAELNIIAVCRNVVKGYEHFSILRHNKDYLELQHIERVSDLSISTKDIKFSTDEKKQLKAVIETNLKDFSFAELQPVYVSRVKELIEQKAQGNTIQIREPTATSELQEKNLLDTLKLMSKQAIKKEVE